MVIKKRKTSPVTLLIKEFSQYLLILKRIGIKSIKQQDIKESWEKQLIDCIIKLNNNEYVTSKKKTIKKGLKND